MMADRREIDRLVGAALDEDAPWGDLTSETLIPEDAVAAAELVAREPGVLSGIELYAAAFRLVDPRIVVELLAADGDAFDVGAVLARVQGPARGILTAERASSTHARRRRGCAASSGRPCATAAAATTAARSRTPSWPRTTTSPCSRPTARTSQPRCAPRATGCRTPPTSRSRSTGSTRSIR